MRIKRARCVKITAYVLLVCVVTQGVVSILSKYTQVIRVPPSGERMLQYDLIPKQYRHQTNQEALPNDNRDTRQWDDFPQRSFPSRDNTDLNRTLRIAYEIMRPVIEEIEAVRDKLLSLNSPWEQPHHPSTVLASDNQFFMNKLKRYSVDILDTTFSGNTSSNVTVNPPIRTIDVWAATEKLQRIFRSGYFMNYASNDCSSVEKGTVYGHKMARSLYNATCNVNIRSAWRTKPFQTRAFRSGLPQKYDQTENGTHHMTGFIHVIKNGVVDLNGDVSSGKLKIIIRRCSMTKSKSVVHPHGKKLYKEVFSIAQFWGSGFYHGTIEDVTRIGPYVHFLRKYKNIKVHVNSRAGFIKAFMRHLGISSSRIVVGGVGARILYVPAGTPCGRPNIFSISMLSMEFRSRIRTPVEPRQSILIIKRTIKRRFLQHNNITSMLESVALEHPELGIKVEVYPDNPVPSLPVTLEMFNRAFIVIAPHGAGESNLLFSEPGTVMIEGLCRSGGRANLCYRNLAQVLGHRYYGILGKNSCYTARPSTIKTPLKQILKMYFKEYSQNSEFSYYG